MSFNRDRNATCCPCKECEERYPACHDRCPAYRTWRKKIDNANRMRAEEQDKYGCNKEKERQIWRKMRWR